MTTNQHSELETLRQYAVWGGPHSVYAWAEAELDRLYGIEEQYEGMKARYDSYEPGTMKGQVRAIWDLAEHYGHPLVSSKHPVGFLQRYIEGLQEQLEAAREAVQACYDDLLRYAPPHWRNQGKGEILARNFLNSNPASIPEPVMGCGHSIYDVVSSDEGTSYCAACEAQNQDRDPAREPEAS